MRILFCINSFSIGGFSSHTLNFGNEFKENGCEIFLLVLSPYGELYPEFKSTFQEVFVVERGMMMSRERYAKGLLDVIINKIRPDIILNNGVPFIQALYPVLPTRLKRYTVIHSIGDYEVKNGIAFYNYTNKIICVSKNIFEKVSNLIPNDSIVLIPVGIKQLGKGNVTYPAVGIIKLIYVGRITKLAKNLLRINEVLNELQRRQVEFSMTFIGDGEYLKEYKSILVKNFGSKVNFLGALAPHQIHNVLKQHNVFILTSIFEGTPHALLEAMSLGVIPVVSFINGSTDIITHGVNGFLCETNNTNMYAENIEYLSNNPEIQSRISNKCINFVEEKYLIKNVAMKYMKLFEDDLFLLNPLQSKFNFNEISEVTCPPTWKYLRTILGNFYRRIFKGIKPVNYKM